MFVIKPYLDPQWGKIHDDVALANLTKISRMWIKLVYSAVNKLTLSIPDTPRKVSICPAPEASVPSSPTAIYYSDLHH